MEANIYETKISIHKADSDVSETFETQKNDLFKETLRFLGSIGFFVGEDKDYKGHYEILMPYHKYGRYADLEFKASIYGVGFEIIFFQNVYYENPNGGYSDFDKLKKMPYLIRLQFELTIRKLTAFFENMDIEVRREKEYKGAEYIAHKYIESWHKPQKEMFDLSEIDGETPAYSYQSLDRDHKVIRNGDLKYYRDDCTGYLHRGKAYHNINNMWWVLQPCGTVRNVAAFELFDLQEGDTLGRVAPDRTPDAYKLRKEQLGLCSTKELVRELKRRDWRG